MRKDKRNIKDKLRFVIAAELKKYREKQGLSQERLARNLQISVRTYSDLEHGVTLPSTMTMLYFMAYIETEELTAFMESIKNSLE